MTPHGGEEIDALYLVRPGETNHELVMSLRSLANAPFIREVWIVGHQPRWVTNVHHIPAPRLGTKYETTTVNLLTACRDDRMSENVVMMHDDHFVVELIDRVPALHRGPIADVLAEYRRKGIRSSRYVQGMEQTLGLLESVGLREPLSYELHVPMTINRASMAETLEWVQRQEIDVPHKRSIWANLAQVGGDRSEDVKVLRRRPGQPLPPGPFLSSSDRSFMRTVGQPLQRMFPEPCRYEQVAARRQQRRRQVMAGRGVAR